MFLHKNIKLFGHLALLKGGVLVKKVLQWFAYQI